MRHDYEKAYDAIAVKEVIARSSAARAAVSQRARDRVLRFSAAIFEHVEHERAVNGPPDDEHDAGEYSPERLRDLLGDLILADLRALPRRTRQRAEAAPPELIAHWLASTFVVVLDWWQASATPVSAHEANELFRSLVVPGLTGALG